MSKRQYVFFHSIPVPKFSIVDSNRTIRKEKMRRKNPMRAFVIFAFPDLIFSGFPWESNKSYPPQMRKINNRIPDKGMRNPNTLESIKLIVIFGTPPIKLAGPHTC